MRRFLESGSKFAKVRPELEPLVDGVAFEPKRAKGADARSVLERDGAVILSGYQPKQDSLIVAAAEMLGTRLRDIQPARTRDLRDGEALPLHTEHVSEVIEVHGDVVDLYCSDADYLLILCARQAENGGTSVVADGYKLIERLRHGRPELWAMLTRADVDQIAPWRDESDVADTPSATRLVQYTRTGRMVVNATWGARLLPREPRREEYEPLIELYADVWTTLTAIAPRFRLGVGEILFVDNYRCFHGVDAWNTRRIIHTLTVRSIDAMTVRSVDAR
jgi:gamma-butyrobetaine dioxygenase